MQPFHNANLKKTHMILKKEKRLLRRRPGIFYDLQGDLQIKKRSLHRKHGAFCVLRVVNKKMVIRAAPEITSLQKNAGIISRFMHLKTKNYRN